MSSSRRIIAVALVITGIVFILLPFLPGFLLVLAGAGILSPRVNRRLRAWRDRIVYRRMGGK